MASHKHLHFRLTPAAQSDLETIWLYTAQNWSMEQADRYTDILEEAFDTILTMPEIARERREFSPPVRIHLSAQHAIIYRIESDHIAIIRILGGKQNWKLLLEE